MAVAAPTPVRTRLQDGGWNVTDPRVVSQDPWSYQQYLRRSRAEFCVAKHGYVRTHCGWFSDRSTGYLASGRPVVVQDTGFSDFLPCGQGLLAYRTPQEAVAAIRQVNEEYDIHCRAARVVVEKCFDARRVLGQLLEASI
jgi:hypothetical protein